MVRLYRDDVNPTGGGTRIIYLDEIEGDIIDSVWDDIPPVNPVAKERQDYPTQKPEALVERIINASTEKGALVFDCFMGAGTTQAAAMKLGRRFLGADINLGAIQTTTRRLIGIANEIRQEPQDGARPYTGFEVYNVNHYDIFRNPAQAQDLLLEALEVQRLELISVFDGEKDGRMVKIMPVNRIATSADLNELIAGFDFKAFERRQAESPNKAVERINLVCMGHEPDLRRGWSSRPSPSRSTSRSWTSSVTRRTYTSRTTPRPNLVIEERTGHQALLPDEPAAKAVAAEGSRGRLARTR